MGRYGLDTPCSFKTLIGALGWIFVEIFGLHGVLVRQNIEFFRILDFHYESNGFFSSIKPLNELNHCGQI